MLSPAPQKGGTPLILASLNGHLEVVGVLLEKGAGMEAKDNVSIARACALCPSLQCMHNLQYTRARTRSYYMYISVFYMHIYNTEEETGMYSVEGGSDAGVKERQRAGETVHGECKGAGAA
jgi:hypothetical protein